jgi:ketosteroid isomerase-like protein
MLIKHLTFGLITTLLIAAAGSFPANAHGDEKHPEDNPFFVGIQSPAAKVVSAFHKALKQGDTKAAREILSDSVIIFEGGGIERSAEEYASHHMLADMKYLAAMESELLEHQVFTMGDMAYSISRSKSKGHYKGKEINSTGMESITLKNTASGWTKTHSHWSK